MSTISAVPRAAVAIASGVCIIIGIEALAGARPLIALQRKKELSCWPCSSIEQEDTVWTSTHKAAVGAFVVLLVALNVVPIDAIVVSEHAVGVVSSNLYDRGRLHSVAFCH